MSDVYMIECFSIKLLIGYIVISPKVLQFVYVYLKYFLQNTISVRYNSVRYVVFSLLQVFIINEGQ